MAVYSTWKDFSMNFFDANEKPLICYYDNVYEGYGDYEDVTIEASSIEDFVAVFKAYDKSLNRGITFNPENVFIRYEPTKELLNELSLKTGGESLRVYEQKKQLSSLASKKSYCENKLSAARQELQKYRKEMTQAAITGREEEIVRLDTELQLILSEIEKIKKDY